MVALSPPPPPPPPPPLDFVVVVVVDEDESPSPLTLDLVTGSGASFKADDEGALRRPFLKATLTLFFINTQKN